MQTATMRDVRYDFGKIEAWLAMGEEVVVTRHSLPVARIVKETAVPKKIKMPDFEARARKIFGDRILPNAVLEARKEDRW